MSGLVGQRVVRVEIGRGRGRKGGRVGGEGNDWARREGEWEGEVRKGECSSSYISYTCICRELKKHSFLEFYDYYISTTRQLSATVEGQQMIVSTMWNCGWGTCLLNPPTEAFLFVYSFPHWGGGTPQVSPVKAATVVECTLEWL